jgi:hypothetical protein
MKSKFPVLATEYRFQGNAERAVGQNGELNASSKRDLMQRQLQLVQATANGEIFSSEARLTRALKGKQLLEAMFNDDQVHKELGETMGRDLYQAANRRGFARKFMNRQDLAPGVMPVVKLRRKDVTVVYVTTPSKTESQIMRDKIFTPPEVILEARPFVQLQEINTSTTDVLDEKFGEALEAIMVGEDKLWKKQADATIGLDNELSIISGTLTPLTLMEVRQNVARWNLPVPSLLMASDLYTDIVGDTTFIQAIEPVARHELIMTGELAVLYGMSITSDAYRHPEHRVLNQGEFYAISDPVTHGQYTDRGGVDTEAISGATEKIPGKGWWVYESYSSVIANSRSVAKGIRR